MEDKTPIYKLDEKALDSLNRFVKARNPISHFVNIIINVILMLGRFIKNLIKPKQENIIDESKAEKIDVEVNKIINKSGLDSIKQLISIKDCNLFINLRRQNSDTSGAQDYSDIKIEELSSTGIDTIELLYERFTDNWFIKLHNSDIEVALNDLNDIDELFIDKNVKLIFINNLIFYNNIEKLIDKLCKIYDKYQVKIQYVFHDYLSVCPSNFLIDFKGEPCDKKDCNNCLVKNNYRSMVRNNMDAWRKMFNELFKRVSIVTFFSDFSKDMVLDIYPALIDKCEVVPHKLLMDENASKYIALSNDGQINIGFVGYFHHIKGSDYFISVVERLKKEYKVNATIIGYLEQGKQDEFEYDYKITGRYNRDDLGRILTENKIDFVIYPSLNSETYSYIVQELMYLNVPVVVFKRGAPSSRIEQQNYQYGEIASEISIDSLYDASVRMIKKLKNV